MRIFILLSIYLLIFYTYGQSYEVLHVKKAFLLSGEKVKKGDYLTREDSLLIKEKGEISLDIESAMHLRLGPGYYLVGKESKRLNEWYATHLRLSTYLKKRDLILCSFKYKTIAVPGTDRHYELDRIEVDQKGRVTITNDTTSLKIKWHNPERSFKGKYYFVLRDYFNQGFIDIIETDEETLTIYPARYHHKYMYYTILADNCRASLRYKIGVESPSTYSYGETNFLQPDAN